MDCRAPIISWSSGMSSSPSEDSVAEECNHDDNDHNNHAKDLISSGSEGGESTNRDETITTPITTPLVDVKTKATMPAAVNMSFAYKAKLEQICRARKRSDHFRL